MRLFPLFQSKPAATTTTDDELESDTHPPADGAPNHAPSSDLSRRSSPPASSPVSVVLDLTSDNEGSELAPIVIDSSPIRPPRRSTYRSPSVQLLDAPSHPARKRRKLDAPPEAPLPDRFSQHVLESRTVYTSSKSPLPRRNKENFSPQSPTKPILTDVLRSLVPSSHPNISEAADNTLSSPSLDPDTAPNSFPEYNLYPALARLADPKYRSRNADEDRQQTWAEKWRPRRADEVLGNEWSACYLRDWMDALRLHYTAPPSSTPPQSSQPQGSQGKARGPKKSISRSGSLRNSQGPRGSQGRGTKRKAAGPTVVREVARKAKRARRELDDFMVSDEDDAMTDISESPYAGVDFGDDDDLGLGGGGGSFAVDPSAPPAGAAPVPATPFVFQGSIRNTMLLVGPSGSGKTAAVYACAEELGWAVFEVHPGIGRRGAAQLDVLVGDVGRNHTLAPAATQSGSKSVFSMLAPGGKSGRNEEDTEPETEKVAPTQSAVLFEEVDVLFAEDASFWAALVTFIKESRRPVVLTCNDVSLIPTADLPLERVVEFKRPSADLARAAVRGVCVAEGQRVPRAAATPSARVGGVDLRQALHQSQLGLVLPEKTDRNHASVGVDEVESDRRGAAGHGMLVDHTLFIEPAIEGPHPSLEALRQAERNADGACFVDAYLARPNQSALTMLELAEPHADDEVGLRAICTVRRPTAPVEDAFYSVDEDVARAVGWRDREERSGDDGEGYIDRLVTVLEKSRVPGDRLTDRRGLVLDYGPWLREIGKVEEADAAAAAAAAAEALNGRRGLRGRQTPRQVPPVPVPVFPTSSHGQRARTPARQMQSRPMSPYKFGDAPPDASAVYGSTSSRGRDSIGPPPSATASPGSDARAGGSPGSNSTKAQGGHAPNLPMRATGSPSLSAGTKRKLSHAQQDDIDPQLIGPGVQGAHEHDGPAQKRRGSLQDAQRRAEQQQQQSAPPPSGPPAWWGGPGHPPLAMPGPDGAPPPPGAPPFPWPPHFDNAGGPPRDAEGRPIDPAAFGMVPPGAFPGPRGGPIPPAIPGSTADRVLRSRSRPPSEAGPSAEPMTESEEATRARRDSDNPTPYSRSPELRVSHKLAERKRRKEMKDLFDELRDQLPADRAMKASKWEILSKAIDFINQLKTHNTDLLRENEVLRNDMENVRTHGMHPFPQGAPIMYPGHGHHPGVPPYPLPIPPGAQPPSRPDSQGPTQNGDHPEGQPS
ncbi:hypothetical protein PENSPDRAFT_731338 [Peniophora sp. CONT]|nr:hypothetical protein PENSPDRAFT_731338 [Peniophora sp. CONT]